MRSFSLKDPEAYAILCGDREYSELPRDVRWPRKAAEVSVRAASQYEADVAFEEWQRHLDAGRIGPQTPGVARNASIMEAILAVFPHNLR